MTITQLATCAECQKPLPPPVRKGGRPRRYCCSACRWAAKDRRAEATDRSWSRYESAGGGSVAQPASLACELPLAEVYRNPLPPASV